MTTLNVGILAHVDAGKTTLTERLLYAAGVIDELGSVDDGSTQTDTLALEQRRGITIRSAVASFTLRRDDGSDVAVNLIDTPGHADFVAEVERALSVLDGAVLVVSAVEGVQAQTRILMRVLQRLRIPTVLFLNKVDRPGADVERIVRQIADKLTSAVVALSSAREAGTPNVVVQRTRPDVTAARLRDVLSDNDEVLLTELVEGADVSPTRLSQDSPGKPGKGGSIRCTSARRRLARASRP